MPQKPHMVDTVTGTSAMALLNRVQRMWGTVDMSDEVRLVGKNDRIFFINLSNHRCFTHSLSDVLYVGSTVTLPMCFKSCHRRLG